MASPLLNPGTNVSTTKMSSKGQVVIPEQIRAQLALEAGSRFVVVGEKDVVILKRIAAPSLDEFGRLIKKARSRARAVGLKKSDIEDAVTQARKK